MSTWDMEEAHRPTWSWDNSHCDKYSICGKKLATYEATGIVRCLCFYRKKFSARIGPELFSPNFYKKSQLTNYLSRNIRLAGDLEEIKRHITTTLGASTALSGSRPLPVLDVCSLVDVYLNQHSRWNNFGQLYDERHMIIKVGFQRIENKKTVELLHGLLIAREHRGLGTWLIQSKPLEKLGFDLGNDIIKLLKPLDGLTFTKRETAKVN